MKPHLDIEHLSNSGDTDRVRMSFDEDSIPFLQSVLTDLYSDKELAVTREYSTNAWDSHVAAGKTDIPIEITRPTSPSPTFIVKDYGVGMSVDELTNRFSKYGYSSKRGDDSATGLLGLGCKAGLTYSSQFTVVSVKDGTKATVLVTRDSDGCGALQFMDVGDTDEENGVEIRVPVTGVYGFNEKITKFFRFWKKGTVLVDGVEIEHVGNHVDDIWLDDDILMTTQVPQDTLVMGGVSYPLKIDLSQEDNRAYNGFYHGIGRYAQNYSVIAFVDIGSVDFTPSREDLHYTKRTKLVCTTVYEFVTDKVRAMAQDDINKASTPAEALARYRKWIKLTGKVNFTYWGKGFPTQFKAAPDEVQVPSSDGVMRTVKNHRQFYTWSGYHYDRAHKQDYITWDNVDNAVIVEGHKGTGLTERTKYQFAEWWRVNGNGQIWNTHHRVIFTHMDPGTFGAPWLDNLQRVDYVTLKAIRLPHDGEAKEKKDRKEPTKYPVYSDQGYRTMTLTELPKKRVAWIGRWDVGDTNALSMNNLVIEAMPGWVVVELMGNQVNKFERECPQGIPLSKAIVQVSHRAVKMMPESQRYKINDDSFNGTSTGVFTQLHHLKSQIFDSEVVEVSAFLRDVLQKKNWVKWDAIGNLAGKVGMRFGLAKVPRSKYADILSGVLTKYPLVQHLGSVYDQEGRNKVIRYMNDTFLLNDMLSQGLHYARVS